MKTEVNSNFVEDSQVKSLAIKGILITPPIGEDYWLYKVQLTKDQAVIGFPKFGVIGIGFLVEKGSWNTNLPSNCDAETIYNHIKCNKGNTNIKKQDCIKAIKLIQNTIRENII